MKKKLAIVLCLAVLAGVCAIYFTISYLQDEDTETNKFVVGDIEVDLTEDEWTPEDELEARYPGDVKYKNPTIKAVTGDIYFRVKVELLDSVTQSAVSDAAADLIWNTIYYEATATEFVEDVTGIGSTTKTRSDLVGYSNYNEGKFTDTTPEDAPDNVKYYTYTNGGSDPAVLSEGSEVTLFTTIVIPADYNSTDFTEMGNYEIKITVQAIQAANIDETDAADVLDAAFPS